MTQTRVHALSRPLKTVMPRWIWDPIRRAGTALLTPIRFSWQSGHFRSSLRARAVSRDGHPLPWYTYPAIDFLAQRSFAGRAVLEFGGGQSTYWWATRAARVVALEGDAGWYRRLQADVPPHVELRLVSVASPEACVADVEAHLAALGRRFDVVVIDGLWRTEMVDVAARVVTGAGIILVDDAEGYGFREAFVGRGFERVDFFGQAPGVILPRCTSMYFRPGAFVLDAAQPLPVIARARP